MVAAGGEELLGDLVGVAGTGEAGEVDLGDRGLDDLVGVVLGDPVGDDVERLGEVFCDRPARLAGGGLGDALNFIGSAVPRSGDVAEGLTDDAVAVAEVLLRVDQPFGKRGEGGERGLLAPVRWELVECLVEVAGLDVEAGDDLADESRLYLDGRRIGGGDGRDRRTSIGGPVGRRNARVTIGFPR